MSTPRRMLSFLRMELPRLLPNDEFLKLETSGMGGRGVVKVKAPFFRTTLELGVLLPNNNDS
jgi:hypothetical protein